MIVDGRKGKHRVLKYLLFLWLFIHEFVFCCVKNEIYPVVSSLKLILFSFIRQVFVALVEPCDRRDKIGNNFKFIKKVIVNYYASNQFP